MPIYFHMAFHFTKNTTHHDSMTTLVGTVLLSVIILFVITQYVTCVHKPLSSKRLTLPVSLDKLAKVHSYYYDTEVNTSKPMVEVTTSNGIIYQFNMYDVVPVRILQLPSLPATFPVLMNGTIRYNLCIVNTTKLDWQKVDLLNFKISYYRTNITSYEADTTKAIVLSHYIVYSTVQRIYLYDTSYSVELVDSIPVSHSIDVFRYSDNSFISHSTTDIHVYDIINNRMILRRAIKYDNSGFFDQVFVYGDLFLSVWFNKVYTINITTSSVTQYNLEYSGVLRSVKIENNYMVLAANVETNVYIQKYSLYDFTLIEQHLYKSQLENVHIINFNYTVGWSIRSDTIHLTYQNDIINTFYLRKPLLNFFSEFVTSDDSVFSISNTGMFIFYRSIINIQTIGHLTQYSTKFAATYYQLIIVQQFSNLIMSQPGNNSTYLYISK
jgi:hypothetical protein